MACFSPINAYRTKNGVSFRFNDDDCIGEIKLPCGKCVGCKLDYSKQWAIRCVQEASLHDKNCFLTLTLSNENLNSKISLDKSDFQLFMKRLRKAYPRRDYGRIGYFMCGEYGENFSRPHYHACLFNFDFKDKKEIEKSRSGHVQYSSDELQKIWKLGRCTIGEVTPQSAAYVARYVTKKVYDASSDDYYNGRLPEYTACSRRPAIGLEWIKKFHSDVYNYDHVVVEGMEMRPPRYYDKYFEKNFPEKFLDLKVKREQKADLQSLSLESSLERRNVRLEHQLLVQQRNLRSFEQSGSAQPISRSQENYDQKVIRYNNEILKGEKNEKAI